MSHIECNDMVAHMCGGEMIGGNYIINSALMKTGMNPISDEVFTTQFGGRTTFDTLGIPGLYVFSPRKTTSKDSSQHYNNNQHKTLTDDIHDRLLELASSSGKHHNNKQKSKKRIHHNIKLSKTKKR